jgi:hypothetical protein
LSIQNVLGGYEAFRVPETLEELVKDIETQINIYHIIKKNDLQIKEVKSA